jgi:DNA polymerase III alpha subunit
MFALANASAGPFGVAAGVCERRYCPISRIHLLNVADDHDVDLGFVSSETEYFMRGRVPRAATFDVVIGYARVMLQLIRELEYEAYFVTVYDIVRFARSQHILCQGRGSAANSAVCYCLGVTEVNPARGNMLFERFISKERGEPPDIDVDFEHQRREEVIQYIYAKYGRDRAAIAAAVSTYRPRGALRETEKALGVDPQIVDRVAKSHQWFDDSNDLLRRFAESGLLAEIAPQTTSRG